MGKVNELAACSLCPSSKALVVYGWYQVAFDELESER